MHIDLVVQIIILAGFYAIWGIKNESNPPIKNQFFQPFLREVQIVILAEFYAVWGIEIY